MLDVGIILFNYQRNKKEKQHHLHNAIWRKKNHGCSTGSGQILRLEYVFMNVHPSVNWTVSWVIGLQNNEIK